MSKSDADAILGLTRKYPYDHFKKFVVALARRTPESQEKVFSELDIDFEEVFDNVAADVLRQGGYEVPEKEWFERDPDVLKLKQVAKSNQRANFAAGDHPLLRQDAEQFSREVVWGIARICLPRRSFVIGSHGLTIVERDGSIKGSWLPIAHDVAIWFTGFPNKGYMLYLDRKKESIIKTINRATVAAKRHNCWSLGNPCPFSDAEASFKTLTRDSKGIT